MPKVDGGCTSNLYIGCPSFTQQVMIRQPGQQVHIFRWAELFSILGVADTVKRPELPIHNWTDNRDAPQRVIVGFDACICRIMEAIAKLLIAVNAASILGEFGLYRWRRFCFWRIGRLLNEAE